MDCAPGEPLAELAACVLRCAPLADRVEGGAQVLNVLVSVFNVADELSAR